MKRLLILLSLVFPILLTAQVVKVSDEIPLRNDVSYEVLGELKGRVLLFRDRTTEFEVQAFNDQMREIWSKELDLDRRLPVVVGLSSSDQDFTVIYRYRRKSDTVLKAHKYDPGANLIDSVTIKDFGYLFFTPDFELILSEDRSKALIYYIEKQSILHAVSFDVTTMQKLWDRTFTPEEYDASRDILHGVVDNQGIFYLIIEKNNLRYKKDNHFYEIHQFGTADGAYNRMNISLDGKLTYDVYFSFDNLNNNLVAGGLYAENNPGRATGYFILTIDRDDGRKQRLVFHPFTEEFIATLMGKEVEDNKGIMECSVQDLVIRQDGGLLIIGERNRQYERRLAGANRLSYEGYNRYIVDYFYDDLFVLSLNSDGTSHWEQVLHKKQYSQDDDGIYSSYFLFKTPRRLRFLFNDEIKYENTVSEYILTGTGKYDRNSVLSTENLKLRLRFRDATQTSGHRVIIPSERRNNLRLVKVEY